MSDLNETSDDIEKGEQKTTLPRESVDDNNGDEPRTSPTLPPTGIAKVGSYVKRFEQQLVAYNLESRGIQRVEEHERIKIGWLAYLQVFVLWISINLAANNITLGMLGPAVYKLSFRDASVCAVFGAIAGSLPVSWIATWGPISGNRTMVIVPVTTSSLPKP